MSPESTVLLLGTFDTKGHEYAFVRDRLRDLGVGTLLVDVGIREPLGVQPDIPREEVAQAAGAATSELAAAGDRGAAVDTMDFSMVSSTSRLPSSPTSSWGACSRPDPIAWRRPVGGDCPRS